MEFNLTKNSQDENSQYKHKQKIESMSFDLLKSELELTKLIATQEVDKYKWKCLNLEELTSRLQHDLEISREREMKDQEKIKNLLTKMEMNGKDYTEKLVELEMKIFDLGCANEAIKSMHCQKRSSLTETGELQLPSKSVTGTPIKKGITNQKGRTASLEKKRMLQTLNSSNTSTATNANNITAHIAKNCTAQMEDPEDLLNSSKGSTRPMKRSRTSDSKPILCTRNTRSCSKVSTKKDETVCRSGIKDSGKELKGRVATSEQIASALKRAEMLQSNLSSHNPSFIKSMIPYTVSYSFFLWIPSKFSKENLYTAGPKSNMVLEDEKGIEYNSKYINRGTMHGLSGGWMGFARVHNLEVGDALVFELTEPSRFKVHIIKAIEQQSGIVSGQNNWIDDPVDRS